MKGRANGEIAGVFSNPTKLKRSLFPGRSLVTASVLVDNEQKLSVPVILPEHEDVDSLCARIDECKEPKRTLFGKLLRITGLVYCPALNDMRWDTKEAAEQALTLMRASLLHDERLSIRQINESVRYEPVEE